MSMTSKSSTWSEKQRLREDIIDAVIKGKRKEVEAMLDQGADPNEGEGGYLTRKTLLILAIENNHIEIAELLVERGADLNASVMINKVNKTVTNLAQEKQLYSLVALIEKTNAANERLRQGVKDGNAAEVQKAVNSGGNINLMCQADKERTDMPEVTLLLYALCKGYLEVATILITAGAELDYVVKWTEPSSGEYSEDTARSYAQHMRYQEIVELIDKETERRRGKISRSATENGRSNHNAKENERSKTGNDDEIEDIEDEDFVELENQTVQSDKPQRNKKSKNCEIS